jgi:hypothetical protein
MASRSWCGDNGDGKKKVLKKQRRIKKWSGGKSNSFAAKAECEILEVPNHRVA